MASSRSQQPAPDQDQGAARKHVENPKGIGPLPLMLRVNNGLVMVNDDYCYKYINIYIHKIWFIVLLVDLKPAIDVKSQQ